MIERAGDMHPTTPDPRCGLRFEDERGVWWVWEPAFDAFYAEAPWVKTDFDAVALLEAGQFGGAAAIG